MHLLDQWREVKRLNPEALALIRVGDFYELFYDDARDAAKLVGLTLTTRDKGGMPPVPMAGFPHHQLEGYLGKLIKHGRRVAVCEMMEKADGKPVERVVVPQERFTLDASPPPAPRRKPAMPPVWERQRLMSWTNELPGQRHITDEAAQ